jgi:hypothetical protein
VRRPVIHLAGLLLLLASLGSAEASVLREGNGSLGAHYIGILLAQQEAAAAPPSALALDIPSTRSINLPASALAHHRAARTLRPPAAQSIAQHAVTGSSL